MPSEVRSMFKIFHMAVQKPIRFRAKPFEALDSKFLMNVNIVSWNFTSSHKFISGDEKLIFLDDVFSSLV